MYVYICTNIYIYIYIYMFNILYTCFRNCFTSSVVSAKASMEIAPWRPAAVAGGGVTAGSVLSALLLSALRSSPPPLPSVAPAEVAHELEETCPLQSACSCPVPPEPVPCPAPETCTCPAARGPLDHLRRLLRLVLELDDSSLWGLVVTVAGLVARRLPRPGRPADRLRGYRWPLTRPNN